MRAYLCGPMRGQKLWGFPAFHDAAAMLRKAGYEVVSPAEHDEALGFDMHAESLDGFDLKATFRWDLEQVIAADAVVVLPGYEESRGATAEVAVARAVGVPVLTLAEALAEGVAS